MSITAEAVYENGMLKLQQPLPLAEREHVRVTVEPATRWTQRTAGLIRWPGDVETLERIALDPDLDPQVGP